MIFERAIFSYITWMSQMKPQVLLYVKGGAEESEPQKEISYRNRRQRERGRRRGATLLLALKTEEGVSTQGMQAAS